MSLVVERGIPIPPTTFGRSDVRNALNSMAVGDSFAVPMVDRERTRAAVSTLRRLLPAQNYVTRTLDTEFRVWRTA